MKLQRKGKSPDGTNTYRTLDERYYVYSSLKTAADGSVEREWSAQDTARRDANGIHVLVATAPRLKELQLQLTRVAQLEAALAEVGAASAPGAAVALVKTAATALSATR